MIHIGKLQKNDCDRFEFEGVVLTSGSVVEIKIGGQWMKGSVEHWLGAYHWFSRPEGVPVRLRNGIEARIKV